MKPHGLGNLLGISNNKCSDCYEHLFWISGGLVFNCNPIKPVNFS